MKKEKVETAGLDSFQHEEKILTLRCASSIYLRFKTFKHVEPKKLEELISIFLF